MNKLFSNLFALAVLGMVVFLFRVQLVATYDRFLRSYFPCQQPIAYSIGTFDKRFGVSQAEFLSSVKVAEKIWEKSIDRNLFDYSPTGRLKINLIYDKRQQVTDSLEEIGTAVDSTKASYDALRVKFETAKAALEADQRLYESKKNAVDGRLASYNNKVESWNAKGGAPRSVYAELAAEKASISSDIAELESLRKKINDEVNEINKIVPTLNSMARSLNLNVESYNTVGGSLGEQFEEGLYKSGPSGEEIDIYQFSNSDKLVRVLAHELGHALGLDHVSDPDAIMYSLNESGNDKATESDLLELNTLCGVKK